MSAAAMRGGRYRPLSEIGSGGVAVVHRARDERTGADVALKQLLPQFAADRALRRRFLREAEAMRTLDHPGIVRLLDAGEDADTAWLALEFVEGEDLRRRLDRTGPPETGEARRIALAVARALGHAHERGVIHRDLKPQNVLLGSAGVIKLGDFGSARVQALASLTGSSLVWGSPEYMAPEIFARGRVDPRSDILSLGVLLCELGTGRLPWADTATLARLAGGPAAAIHPPALGWGPGVDLLVAAMLHPDPSRRPASTSEVIAVLEGTAPPTALVRTVSCPACGATRAEDLPLCLACGREEIRVGHTPGAPTRLVLNKLGEDAAQTEQIHRLLEGLTGRRDMQLIFLAGDQRLYSKRERAAGIGLPAVLFEDLAPEDGQKLKKAFENAGLSVQAGPPPDGRTSRGFKWTIGALGAGTALLAIAVHPILWILPVIVAGVGAIGYLARKSEAQRQQKRRARFRLREQGAAVPLSDHLLGEARTAATSLAEPEARALFQELSAEIYRLSRRAETWATHGGPAGDHAGSEAALARRLLDAAPALGAQLARAASRLDQLGAALDRQSEGDAVQALTRIERRLATAPAADRGAIEAARTDVAAALERRHAAESERARLSAALCTLLGDLRDAYRRAAALTAPGEREAAAIESATAELERYLDHDAW